MKLLIATTNKHKLREIHAIFSMPSLELVDTTHFPDLPEVVEDGKTFESNAVKKAVTIARASGLWAMADDSGLEVDSLGGAPGVYSARYAGEPVDYDANNKKLLSSLKDITDRKARFKCVIALSSPKGFAQYVEGSCEGLITEEARGANGFGYDPVFIPHGYTCTFAEMDSDIKNSISHRALALMEALEKWGDFFSSGEY